MSLAPAESRRMTASHTTPQSRPRLSQKTKPAIARRLETQQSIVCKLLDLDPVAGMDLLGDACNDDRCYAFLNIDDHGFADDLANAVRTVLFRVGSSKDSSASLIVAFSRSRV